MKTYDEQFKAECLQAGFTETSDKLTPFILDLGTNNPEDYGDGIEPPKMVLVYNEGGLLFCFVSGTGQETVWLNTDSAQEAANWGKMISHIEPNW